MCGHLVDEKGQTWRKQQRKKYPMESWENQQPQHCFPSLFSSEPLYSHLGIFYLYSMPFLSSKSICIHLLNGLPTWKHQHQHLNVSPLRSFYFITSCAFSDPKTPHQSRDIFSNEVLLFLSAQSTRWKQWPQLSLPVSVCVTVYVCRVCERWVNFPSS